jgi:hypothetical protein
LSFWLDKNGQFDDRFAGEQPTEEEEGSRSPAATFHLGKGIYASSYSNPPSVDFRKFFVNDEDRLVPGK